MRRKLRLTSLLAFALLFAVCAPAWGQAGTITGTVTDSVSGEPLPGVNVEIVGTQLGSATGANGTYTITDLEPGTYDLQASFVGYETKTIEGVSVEAGETAVIDVQLAESALQLDEVVAVAYGQQEAQSVTGSVSNLDMDAVDTQPLNSADQALQGQMAGVRVQSASGIPGGGQTSRCGEPETWERGGSPSTWSTDSPFRRPGREASQEETHCQRYRRMTLRTSRS